MKLIYAKSNDGYFEPEIEFSDVKDLPDDKFCELIDLIVQRFRSDNSRDKSVLAYLAQCLGLIRKDQLPELEDLKLKSGDIFYKTQFGVEKIDSIKGHIEERIKYLKLSELKDMKEDDLKLEFYAQVFPPHDVRNMISSALEKINREKKKKLEQKKQKEIEKAKKILAKNKVTV